MNLLLLLACASAPPTPQQPVSEAPQAMSSETERVTVTLEPRYMSYDEGAGTATFSPDSDRQSASYTHYVLDLASLEAALGGRPEAPAEVTLEVSGETRTETPSDPMLPAPSGGFQITTWTGRVVSAGAQ
jgi:hypothetical protein